jgi:serine/threonine protein kinase
MHEVQHGYFPTINHRYHVIEPLGSGGMASVYWVRDKLLERDVALKVLHHHFANDEEFVERFRREARIAASLSHPNIASIHDLGETQNGSYYMAMEYVPGGTLKDRIRGGPLPAREAIAIAIQIAQALRAAHALRTIHRDIKPQNVILTEAGVAKVVDFGIARAAALSEITQAGLILGTEHYMSPEQAREAPVGPQSDLYSLGVVLYEMLTGKLPHEGHGPLLGSPTVAKRLGRYLRPPKEINPFIPEKVSAITVRLLQEEPRHRYQDASSLIVDLEKAKGEPIGSAAARVLSLAFQKGRSLGSATTKVLNAATQQAQTFFESRTQKTKLHLSSTPPRQRIGRCKPARKQRQSIFPRSVLVVLSLLAVLAWLNPAEPGAKSRGLGEVERKVEDSLSEVQHRFTKELEDSLQDIESHLLSGINDTFPAPPDGQQKSKDRPDSFTDPATNSLPGADEGIGESPFPEQNEPSYQTPSGPYNPPTGNPSYPSDSPGGSSLPGIYTPSLDVLPDNDDGTSRQGSYTQPRQEIEEQIDENLQDLKRMFGI